MTQRLACLDDTGQVLTRVDETSIVTAFVYLPSNETLERITQDFGAGRLNLQRTSLTSR